MMYLLSRHYPILKDAGGGDRTRTCTRFHVNGFLDRGSTNYAYSSIHATLTGGRKPLALNAW